MSTGGCPYTWLAGRGHGHVCNNPVRGHSGPHTCACGQTR